MIHFDHFRHSQLELFGRCRMSVLWTELRRCKYDWFRCVVGMRISSRTCWATQLNASEQIGDISNFASNNIPRNSRDRLVPLKHLNRVTLLCLGWLWARNRFHWVNGCTSFKFNGISYWHSGLRQMNFDVGPKMTCIEKKRFDANSVAQFYDTP